LAGVAVVALALLQRPEADGATQDAGALEGPLPAESAACRVAPEGALARAISLEALADASWERVPFDRREAPQAVLRSREAEACFRSASEREGAQRAALKSRTFGSDLMRRWARAKLLLELARRREDATGMRREIAVLLALSSQAGPSLDGFRRHLVELDRAAEARLFEAKAKED